MVREQCPVCSASDLEEMIVLDEYPYAGNGVVQADKADDLPLGSLGIAICRVCGAVFQSDPVSLEQLDEMLARQPSPLPMEETGMEVRETDRFLENLRRYAPDTGRVLEVGSSSGALLRHLKKLGYDVVGVDADPRAVELCRADGLEVTEGRFEEGMFEDESFDMIVARSVLDHAIEPTTLLATMENLLKPGGVLAIEVPNLERIYKRSGFGGFSFHHLMYWTSSTLRYAITVQGLDILGGYAESYLAVFSQKVEEGEEPIDPVPPSDEDVEQTFQMVDEFLARKDRLAEELPNIIQEQFPNGIVVLGAGGPTVDMLYYAGIHEAIKKIMTSDKTRHGAVIAGSEFVVKPMEQIKLGDGDAVLVSSERRQEELLENLQDYLDMGGRVIRFKPDIEVI